MTRKSRGTRAESGITPQRHAQSMREHAQMKDHVPKYHVQPKCFCVLADHSAKTTERWQTRSESGLPPLPETQSSLKKKLPTCNFGCRRGTPVILGGITLWHTAVRLRGSDLGLARAVSFVFGVQSFRIFGWRHPSDDTRWE